MRELASTRGACLEEGVVEGKEGTRRSGKEDLLIPWEACCVYLLGKSKMKEVWSAWLSGLGGGVP
jgi:hypothetical protein